MEIALVLFQTLAVAASRLENGASPDLRADARSYTLTSLRDYRPTVLRDYGPTVLRDYGPTVLRDHAAPSLCD